MRITPNWPFASCQKGQITTKKNRNRKAIIKARNHQNNNHNHNNNNNSLTRRPRDPVNN